MTVLFVYGTLRAGEDNHHLMASAEFLRETRTAPSFTLVSFGAYPAMVATGETSIVGELYRVDLRTLARLDLFEEVPELYRRVEVDIDGVAAAAYVLPRQHAMGAVAIPSGDWRER